MRGLALLGSICAVAAAAAAFAAAAETARKGGRVMTLAVQSPGGLRGDIVTVTELVKSRHVKIDMAGAYIVAIRGGTCTRRTLGRPLRAAPTGETMIAFDDLVGATFSVESYGDDGSPDACADHLARADLKTDARGRRKRGTATIGRARITFQGEYSFVFRPAAGGKKTTATFSTIGTGSSDSLIRIRPGTCRHLTRRPALLFAIPGGDDGNTIRLVTTLRIPFKRFVAEPWVLEEDERFAGPPIRGYCVQF